MTFTADEVTTVNCGANYGREKIFYNFNRLTLLLLFVSGNISFWLTPKKHPFESRLKCFSQELFFLARSSDKMKVRLLARKNLQLQQRFPSLVHNDNSRNHELMWESYRPRNYLYHVKTLSAKKKAGWASRDLKKYFYSRL